MFTGIIETRGKVTHLKKKGTNLEITVESSISSALKIDQSVAHNGVCLTVVSKNKTSHTVVAIEETLKKTTLSSLKIGTLLNLERAMHNFSNFDGHIVQGHVDQTAEVIQMEEQNGSWNVAFKIIDKPHFSIVEKGSICVDGVSLTLVQAKKKKFSVSIIPYTHEHTLFNTYKVGSMVNIEFDIIGKYVETLMRKYKK